MSTGNIFFALLGGIGVFLIFSAFTVKFQSLAGKGLRQRLHSASDPMPDLSPETPFLDRSLSPFLQTLGHFMTRFFRNAEQDEERIRAAGFPKRFRSIYELYAWKAFNGIILFMLGLGLMVVLGPSAIVAALGLGLLGLYLPDITLKQLVSKRAELIRTEMAFIYHRLAVHVAAGRSLQAAIEAVTQTPGGAFIQELRNVPMSVSTGKTFREAMEDLRHTCPGIEEVGRFVDLAMRHERMGSQLHEVLQSTGRMMQDRVQQEIEARGMAASVQMVVPVGGLILPAIAIVVIGPGIYMASQFLTR